MPASNDLEHTPSRMPVRPPRALLVIVAVLCACEAASGESPLHRDTEVFFNARHFIRGMKAAGSTGAVVGVAYDETNTVSATEAKAFLARLRSTASQMNVSLHGRLIEISGLEDHADVHYIYVPHGVDKHYQKIYDFALRNRIFTFSTDAAAVKAPCCILGLNTRSGVEIYLNQRTLRALGFDVDAAFKYMVKQL